jgi:diamine N-acetyltransferase
MTSTYRDATPADAPTLAPFFAESFTATFGHLYAPENLAAFLAQSPAERWAEELTDPLYAIRVAEEGDALVGFAKLGPPALPGAPATAVELRQLYVAEAGKGTGVARALMDWVLATARARGAAELWLSVYIDNHRARRFYARYELEDVGRYAFMVGDHEDEDRLMRLRL